MLPPRVVAEIGCNHMGSYTEAEKLIDKAAACEADYVKFQKRTVKELLTKEEYNKPHPVPENSYGETYGQHREILEFTLDMHEMLKKHAENKGIGYSCSVWDTTSAREIASLKPEFIKVGSPMNSCFPIYDTLLENFEGAIHVSLGMTEPWEEKRIVAYFEEKGAKERLVLYHCNSAYPSDFDEMRLENIKRLQKEHPGCLGYGFSGHHRGIAIDVAAFVLGATWIERHFTLDRTNKGTDHAASLEWIGLYKLKRDLVATAKSMTDTQGIAKSEKEQRDKLKKYKLNEITLELQGVASEEPQT